MVFLKEISTKRLIDHYQKSGRQNSLHKYIYEILSNNNVTNYQELNVEELDIIQKAKKAILGNEFIPCTGCRYCMPCPFGVDIPRVFRTFNMYGIHKDIERFKNDMARFEEKNLPKNCKACKKCMKECPQGIDIPAKLAKINSLL